MVVLDVLVIIILVVLIYAFLVKTVTVLSNPGKYDVNDFNKHIAVIFLLILFAILVLKN